MRQTLAGAGPGEGGAPAFGAPLSAFAQGPWTARRGLILTALPLAALLAFAGASVPDMPICAMLAVFTFVVAVANAHLDGFHPADRFGAANTVTLVRATGAAFLGGLALTGGPPIGAAYWVAAFSALLLALDGIDGWLARRARLASRFGARFDMEIDALTALALCALVWQMEKVGPWVLAIGLMRYAFVAVGAIWPRFAGPLPPSIARKAVCVLQLATLSLLLLPGLTPPLSGVLAGFALAALLWSFGRDLRWLRAR
jgi:phosphatidylglycerophosphate synthase